MLIEDMAEAIGRAHGAALDGLTRTLWAGVAAGEIGDEDAARLAEAIQARRVNAGRPGNLHAASANPDAKRRAVQRPPVRSEAIERRRRLAASGPMPPALAARFTTGELAVLRIVADQCREFRQCVLCLDAIAARAGVSRTLARNAIRQARRLGMVEVRERRRTGAKSLPNVVTVIDREWLAWMKRGAVARSGIGGRNPTTTDTSSFREGRSGSNRCANQGSGNAHRQYLGLRPYDTGASGGSGQRVHSK